MARSGHPLKLWLKQQNRDCDYAYVASRLAKPVHAGSIRQIACGYRIPSWELAFEIESITGISAHDLRDRKWYCDEEAA